jgi:hypothetical protein
MVDVEPARLYATIRQDRARVSICLSRTMNGQHENPSRTSIS